ncbi:hypothetical protein HII13_003504 [Brettanomyces bruxellensis]|nr:hypothetical protein HII13_003504 [Brettanomyces bruxellensis]
MIFARLGIKTLGTALTSAVHSPLHHSVFRPASACLSRSLFIKTIPQPVGNIVGNVNDAYVGPTPNKFTGSRHWTFERAVTICMTPLMITPFITGSISAPIDAAMAGLLLYHCYAGWESCIIDYIPRRVYGVWHTAAMWLLIFGTAVSGYGVYVLETSSAGGLWGLCKRIWKHKKED